jgi:predicted O-methyltransferase YrrM
VTLARTASAERDHTVTSVRTDLRKLFQQVEALQALYHDLQPRQALPRTRSWVASPDLLHFLYVQCRESQPRLVVECGSGLSTVVMAYALRASGHGGKLVSLEHDPVYATATRRLLLAHGVDEVADVRSAPLEEVELAGEIWPWYRLDVAPSGPIDLLVVDGPPGPIRPLARYPAVPLLHDRLSAGAKVILDDFAREDEQEIVALWQREFPHLELTELPHEKGTAVLAR